MANFTYDQFLQKAKQSGLYGTFSEADLNLAKQNADAGMSILQYKQDYMNATTDEQRKAANLAAEKIRSQYGNYTAGSDGNGFYLNDTNKVAKPTTEAYKPSDAVQQALAALQQTGASKPGAYQPSNTVQQAQTALQQMDASKPGAYKPSDAVQQAMALLNQQLASKPGAYQSQWQAGLDEIMNKILNREDFSYDMNADALYQQYKDQYTLQGQQAMMDTMGQAQAMTGGYGNSYAQSVGQQAYQGYMQQLSDKIPELYQLALDRYNREGEEMYNQYGLMADRESLDYDRYRDSVADWNNAYDQAYQQYQTERNFDYGQHRDSVSDWNNAYDRAYQQYMNERDFDYGQHRDSVSDWNTAFEQAYQKYQDERSFDYGKYADDRAYEYQSERDAAADAQWQAEFDEAKRQYDQEWEASQKKSSSGSDTNSTKATAEEEPAPSYQEVKAAYIELAQSGGAREDKDSFLNDAVAAGWITDEEAQKLADIYNASTKKYTAADQMWDRHS